MKKTKNEVYFNPKLGYIWTYIGFKSDVSSKNFQKFYYYRDKVRLNCEKFQN